MGGDLAGEGGEPVRRAAFPYGDTGPEITAADAQAVAAVVAGRQLWRYGGTKVRELETTFAALYGVGPGQVAACSSGTAAVHLAVAAVDPEPGDEIIVPPITDFGSVIPVLAQNAIPVFADVDPETYCLDPADVARRLSVRTRAIICVHLFGQPAPVVELAALARRRGVALIEDCAQAPLARVGGRLLGTFGDFGCFSMQQSKHFTAGEGGLTLAREPQAAQRMRLFADKGWPREGPVRTHLFLGMNYRLTELQAAVALPQLDRLEGIVGRRQQRAARLDALLAGLAGVAVPPTPEGSRSAYWQYGFNIDPGVLGLDAGGFARLVRAEGVPLASGYVPPLYLTPALAERRTYGGSAYPFTAPGARPQPAFGPGLCPAAETAARRLCHLAWHQNYTDADVDDIGRAVRKVATALAARAAGPA